jgi:hypothetical protein
VPSSARYKQDVVPMAASSEGVFQLRPVTFAYKEDAHRVKRCRLIAEEVATVYPEKYKELIPMLFNGLQRQQRELAELKRAVEGMSTATSAR